MSLKILQVLNQPFSKGFLIKEFLQRSTSLKKSTKAALNLTSVESPQNLCFSLAALNINNIRMPPSTDLTKSRITPPFPVSHSIQLPQIQTNVTYEDQLPTKSVEEPISSAVQEKQAARLIVIRRQKMKNHKLKKLRKRMKFEYIKIRLKREKVKEKKFQAELLGAIKLAQSFDPAKYAAEKIAKSKQIDLPPVWYGVKYPEHIIKQLIEEKEKKEKEKLADEKRRASMSPYVKDYLDKLPK